jgi:DNA-binding transcriptional regulator YiaG
MTPSEFQLARARLGLSQGDIASIVGVGERTVRGWEQGHRNGRPNPVPWSIALLIRLVLRHAAVRRDLGIVLDGEGPTSREVERRAVLKGQ